MDKQRFQQSYQKIMFNQAASHGIGTLSEKRLHAILKDYYEDSVLHQERKICGFVADIYNEEGIIEIQTKAFEKMRKKLATFLNVSDVTIVYPIARQKWLFWINREDGTMKQKRKSPKVGTPYEVFFELYKIKMFLENPRLHLKIVLLDMNEYRYLNGWSIDQKKGSTRMERIPIDIIEEVDIQNVKDYGKLIPPELQGPFTSKEYSKATRLSLSSAQKALLILHFVGAVTRVGKMGNAFVYEKSF